MMTTSLALRYREIKGPLACMFSALNQPDHMFYISQNLLSVMNWKCILRKKCFKMKYKQIKWWFCICFNQEFYYCCWLVGWLVGRLVGRLASRLVGWLVERSRWLNYRCKAYYPEDYVSESVSLSLSQWTKK